MTLYRISNDKVCIALLSDDGAPHGGHKGGIWRNHYHPKYRKIVDAPPLAKWAIGKETYHVLRWFRQREFQIQSRKVAD